MLTKLSDEVAVQPVIRKTVNGKDASTRGAFPYGTKIEFTVETPRIIGASAVVLRIEEDGKRYVDIPLDFFDSKNGIDLYQTILNTAEICGSEENGLFYYQFLFLRGYDTLFTSTDNFVDFTLERHTDKKFILLIHTEDYQTPEWFKGRVMYHIFVDRFKRGDGEVRIRDDSILNDDWENGIMQYPQKGGDRLANNMFFGGNLWGICEELEYLKSLGVGIIYLSPIFKAYSNHKYDTGNYLEIDEAFGGEAAFTTLVEKAKELDIKIVLDGVFNHTGDDSLYFDKYGKYGKTGAYSNSESVFKNWYRFKKYPDEYENWWGIDILPKLNHTIPECRKFFTGKGGVAEKYVRMGIGGWRLDVADELSDEFLYEFRKTVKNASDGEGIIIGEVWENAAEKVSYSKRRQYLRGGQLDSVMNYPLRNGILGLLLDGDADFLGDILKSIYASYPKCVCDALMNVLGTHDTQRILTILGDNGKDVSEISNDELSVKRLSEEDRRQGIKKQKLAALIQYTVYGVPSVFYGDEVGVEGYHDPFCRRTFPWGRECEELLEYYRYLGRLRAEQEVFKDGEFSLEFTDGAVIGYSRYSEYKRVTVIVNASEAPYKYAAEGKKDVLTNEPYEGVVSANSAVILE